MYRIVLTFLACQLLVCSGNQETLEPDYICTKVSKKPKYCTFSDEKPKMYCYGNEDDRGSTCIMICEGELLPEDGIPRLWSSYDSKMQDYGTSMRRRTHQPTANDVDVDFSYNRPEKWIKYHLKLNRHLRKLHGSASRQKRQVWGANSGRYAPGQSQVYGAPAIPSYGRSRGYGGAGGNFAGMGRNYGGAGGNFAGTPAYNGPPGSVSGGYYGPGTGYGPGGAVGGSMFGDMSAQFG